MEAVKRSARRCLPYFQLVKPGVIPLILMTALTGAWLGSGGSVRPGTLAAILLGTALAAAGANALNQCLEADRDRRMERTRRRPLASRRLPPRNGWVFAFAVAAAGPLFLLVTVNPLTAGLALVAEVVYVLLYTPLKWKSPACTFVGGVSGAIPPVMGWAAVTGSVELGAIVLAAILYVWQIPHFLAFGWLHREEYARGGFRVLPVVDGGGETTSRLVLLYLLILIPVALSAALVGLAGWLYAGLSIVLGLLLLATGTGFRRWRTEVSARALFVGTLVYLPVILILLSIAPRR
jgi:protoheme IX farnesyltransferase